MAASIIGATGGFHTICRGVRTHGNNATPENYYGGQEARVSLGEGKTLHFLRDGDKFKITLYALGKDGGIGGTSAIKLDTITLDAMVRALSNGTLLVGNNEYKLPNTRALRKIVQ